MKWIPLTLVLAAWATTASSVFANPTWAVTKEIPLAGEGGWDYLAVAPGGDRLFITHANHLLVLDLKIETVTASLDAAGCHGVAFAPDLQRGFISNGEGGFVTIFDLHTLAPIQKVPVGQNPDAICYDAATKRVFAFNGRSDTASAIDGATGKVLGEISLSGKPEFAQAGGDGSVFDNIEDKGLVVKIDAARLTVVAQWPLPSGSEPSALALDLAHHRLFVGCHDKKLRVLDSQSGRIVAALPIGEGVDADFYDPKERRVFVSCGDGTLTVIKELSSDHFAVEAVVKTEPKARTLAFDSATQTAYLPDAKFGPPAPPTPSHPHPWPSVVPGSLKLLVVRQQP